MFKRRTITPYISIAPLIDCILQLLIFFLLTISFSNDSGIEIDLPKGGTSNENLRNSDALVLTISKDRKFRLNGSATSLVILEYELKQRMKENKTKTLVIQMDRTLPVEILTQILTITEKTGITNRVIKTTSEEEKAH